MFVSVQAIFDVKSTVGTLVGVASSCTAIRSKEADLTLDIIDILACT